MFGFLVICASLARPSGRSGGNGPRPDGDDDAEERRGPVTEMVVTSRRLDDARANVEPSLGASAYSVNNDTVEARPGGETGTLVSTLAQFPGARPDGRGG